MGGDCGKMRMSERVLCCNCLHYEPWKLEGSSSRLCGLQNRVFQNLVKFLFVRVFSSCFIVYSRTLMAIIFVGKSYVGRRAVEKRQPKTMIVFWLFGSKSCLCKQGGWKQTKKDQKGGGVGGPAPPLLNLQRGKQKNYPFSSFFSLSSSSASFCCCFCLSRYSCCGCSCCSNFLSCCCCLRWAKKARF